MGKPMVQFILDLQIFEPKFIFDPKTVQRSPADGAPGHVDSQLEALNPPLSSTPSSFLAPYPATSPKLLAARP
ncbi:hypothetical protein ACFX2J_025052 [Malus domestica]